ncbi:MAG: DUF262 domain-containing protein [Planctomycetota bacterium]
MNTTEARDASTPKDCDVRDQRIVRPLKRLRLSTTNRPLDVIRRWRNEGVLMLDLPYQRGDVWGVKRRVNLIRSVLLGVPIPSIVVNDRMNAEWGGEQWHYAVIDGKQRCQTVLMFMDDELAIPGEWVGLVGQVMWTDLPVVQQRKIKQHALGFCEGALESIEQEIEVFELINFGGVPQGESDQ